MGTGMKTKTSELIGPALDWAVTFDPRESDLYLTNDNCLGGIKIIQEFEGISVDFIDNQDATLGSSFQTFKALNAGSEVA